MMWGVDVRNLHLMWRDRRDGYIVQAEQVLLRRWNSRDRYGRHLLPEERQILEDIPPNWAVVPRPIFWMP